MRLTIRARIRAGTFKRIVMPAAFDVYGPV